MSQTLVYSTKDYADYLKHAGVKGMKWGVRKDKDKDKPKSKSTTTIDTTKPKVKIKEEEPAAGGGGGKANTEEDDKRELEAINEVLESGRDMKFKEFTTLLRRRGEIQERMDARNKPDGEKSSSPKEPKKPKALDKVSSEGVSIDKLINLNSELTTEERIARGRKRRLEREKRNGSAKHSDALDSYLTHSDLLSVKMKDIAPDYLAHYQDAIDLDDYLMHYGVIGMKWGVRRTPEQLGQRVSKAGSSLKKKVRSVAGADARTKRKIARTRRKARVEVAKLNAERAVANAKAKQEADAKKRGESSTQSKPGSSTQTTAISKRKGTAGLSDDELRYAVSRMNLEKSYAQLIAESTPKTNKQKFNAWAKKTAISTLETQAKAIINQAAGNTTKKLFAAVSATADEVKDGPKPEPQQPKQKKQS